MSVGATCSLYDQCLYFPPTTRIPRFNSRITAVAPFPHSKGLKKLFWLTAFCLRLGQNGRRFPASCTFRLASVLYKKLESTLNNFQATYVKSARTHAVVCLVPWIVAKRSARP